VELFLIHDAAETKVRNQQICIVLGRAKQQVLGFQIAMYDSMIMEVCNSGKNGPHEIGGIRFEVRAFATYSVEELASECEVGYKVDYRR
jgi:hypothetical protein